MRRRRRLITSITVLVLALSAWAVPAVRAQSTECGLLSAEEANAALGVTDLTVSQGGSTFCAFSGATQNLLLGVTPGQTLEDVRGTDGEDLTVAGLPAYIDGSGTQLSVEHPNGVFGVWAYGAETTDMRDQLIALAELVIPRLPAGPDPADIARLEALMPATVDGSPLEVQTLPGELLLSFMDQTSAPVVALNEALAAQGKTSADVLFVGGETETSDDTYSVIAVLIKGTDAAALLEPLFRAFAASDSGEATFTPVPVGARTVLRIEGATDQDVLYATASGDIIFAVSAPEAELESIFAVLP